MDKITIVMFCYKGDENILEYSLKCANNTFGNSLKIALIDDNNNPISLDILEDIRKKLTCEFVYERSYFNRNKNLNGKECISNEIDLFIKHSKNRDGIVIKLDPDTIIFKRFAFDYFIKSKENFTSITYYSGNCYAIKTKLLEKGKKMLENFEIPNDSGPEDYIIGITMCAADITNRCGFLTVWTPGNETADAAFWNFKNVLIKKNIEMYYNNFEIVSFGNWKFYPYLNRDARIKPMKMMLEYQSLMI